MSEKKRVLCCDRVSCVYDEKEKADFLDGVKKGSWVCYMLRSTVAPNRTYAGVTNDLKHRLRQHNGEIIGGARATRQFRPWKIASVVTGFGSDKSAAMRFEWFLKMSHAPGAKPYVQSFMYAPPPKAIRESSLSRRASLFARAYEKITSCCDARVVCLDSDFGCALTEKISAVKSTDHPEPEIRH